MGVYISGCGLEKIENKLSKLLHHHVSFGSIYCTFPF